MKTAHHVETLCKTRLCFESRPPCSVSSRLFLFFCANFAVSTLQAAACPCPHLPSYTHISTNLRQHTRGPVLSQTHPTTAPPPHPVVCIELILCCLRCPRCSALSQTQRAPRGTHRGPGKAKEKEHRLRRRRSAKAWRIAAASMSRRSRGWAARPGRAVP